MKNYLRQGLDGGHRRYNISNKMRVHGLVYQMMKLNKGVEDHSYPQSEVLIKDKRHDHVRIDKMA